MIINVKRQNKLEPQWNDQSNPSNEPSNKLIKGYVNIASMNEWQVTVITVHL